MEIEDSSRVHVMLVSFPGQGHVNPLLRLGKLIASKGLLVTFVTTELWGKKMRKTDKMVAGEVTPVGKGFLRFEFYDDEWSEDDERRADFPVYRQQIELTGKREISRLIKIFKDKNEPVSCLVNNPFIAWVCDLAEELHIASAVLWVQSCACFSAYYHYEHRLARFPTEAEPEIDVQLPCMPLLKHDEIPSFLHPLSPYGPFREVILEQFRNLNKPFCILIDTFDAIEHDIIDHMSKFCPLKPVGPLFKLAKSIAGGDISQPATSDHCLDWLPKQPPSSVVYISFGTVVFLKQEQIDEIAHGVLNADVSFLWVVRPPPEGLVNVSPHVFPQELREKTDKGKIVEWCPQERVLSHPAVACFVTHCGWNSTIEALSLGVPVVCFPQWGDQVTDAVYLTDVFKTGLRLSRGEAEKRIVPRDEVAERLREATTEDLRRRALKWKAAAEAAVAAGGSSDRNLQEFVDKLRGKSKTVSNGVSVLS
ncbi:PREDICTED: UDP-glycosyltransferase 84A1-like [Tarenaya hassleriana]|uniref:UDP-glycosyltransferase 84A1-like n=1 Tax=Tarenaya hassleriana TaxID=28532 RepID=UPI00053C0CBD|nr:PREDICTED: UDP-glycosyltransferase 84A1-like [Tarenaya hassleriana]